MFNGGGSLWKVGVLVAGVGSKGGSVCLVEFIGVAWDVLLQLLGPDVVEWNLGLMGDDGNLWVEYLSSNNRVIDTA